MWGKCYKKMRKKDANGHALPHMRGKVIWEHIYEVELYEESENAQFDVILRKVLILYPDIDYAYIFHNRCKFDNGEPKKPHYHLLLNFPREKSMNKLIQELGVPSQLVTWKAYLDDSVQYLIHLNHPQKTQYEVDEITSNNDWALRFLGGDFSSNQITELTLIVEFVKRHDRITFYDIFTYCSEHNLLYTYRKWYQQIRDIYKEN